MPQLKNAVWAIGFLACTAVANEDFFDSVEVELDNETEQDSTILSHRGYVQLIGKYGLQDPDPNFPFARDRAALDRVRTDAFIELRGEASDNVYWQLSAKAELDWLQWQQGERDWTLHREDLRLKDAYLDASFNNGLWLRAGNQVLAWGDSEGLTITDVLSPVDSREPGQAELQDLREQIPAIMVSLPSVGGKLSTVVTYQAGHNRYADSDQAFYPYIALVGSGVTLTEQAPEQEWELAVRWERQFNGGDVSLMAAEVNDNAFSVRDIQVVNAAPLVTLSQERIRVAGATMNRVFGDWLLRAELAHYWDQPVELGGTLPWVTQNQWRSMAGIEYAGINDLTITYEASSIFAPEVASVSLTDTIKTSQWQLGHVFRMRHTALNERFTHSLWLMALTSDDTQLARWDMSYQLSDKWTLALAAIGYRNRNPASMLYAFRANDTLNASVKLSF